MTPRHPAPRFARHLGLVAGLAALAVPLATVPTTGATAAPVLAATSAPAYAAPSAPATLPGGLTPAAFAQPPGEVRPATRWWWQAPLSQAEALRELRAIADAGFGEVEIAYSAGAWATDEQRTILGAVLDLADQLGVKVSMTMGAAWPVNTPNTGQGSGLASQELQYGRADVPGGRQFTGAVPAPIDAATKTQTSTLVAVTAARVVRPGPAVTTPGQPPASSTVLDPDTLVDLTGQVQDGALTWRAPDSGDWVLFAFWSRENERYNTNPFDADAARQAAADLDELQLGDANAPKLQRAGADLFEDSLELHGVSIFWTPTMQAEFASRRGYDMAKYLPLMFAQGMSDFPVPPVEPIPDFDLPDQQGVKVRGDYYTTLTDLYVDDHLAVFQDWAEGYGMQYKAQAAFLQDLGVVRSFRELIGLGGRGETESLNMGENLPITTADPAWRNSLENQRKIASGVHQAGSNELSSELGAVFTPAYTMNLDDYRQLMSKEWAAGVSQPFLHGFAFQSAGAAWPGKARFGERVTESWNDQTFPQWASWPALTAYFARGTQVLESGTAKVDVAVYDDAFVSPRGSQSPFDPLRLERAGFTTEYLDPEGLAEATQPTGGELFADTAGYRAVVVDQRSVSAPAAAALVRAARAGVRVVFVGELPTRDTTWASGANGDAAVRDAVAATLAQPTATRVADQGDVAAALGRLGLTPRTATGGTQVLSQWREVDGGSYVYLYNPANQPVSLAPSFETAGVPSHLDLFSGDVSEVPQYSTAGGRTTVPLTLAPLEGTVITLDTTATPPPVRVEDADAHAGGDLVYDAGRIVFRATESGEQSFRLSDGRTRTVAARPGEYPQAQGPQTTRPNAIDAWTPWSLSVQTQRPTGGSTVVVAGPLGDSQFQQYRLKDWRAIPAISGESGVGTYTSTTTLPEGWNADPDDGVWMSLGHVDGTAELSVNGTLVGTQLTDAQRWDVTPYLQTGLNTVQVVVRTTLRNAVTSYNRQATSTQPYGLRGPVRLLPYDGVMVHDPATAPVDTRVEATAATGAYGSALTVPVTVTAPRGTPTGTVSLSDGARELGSAPLAAGTATVTIPALALPAGSHPLRVSYTGDDADNASSSTTVVTVAKAATTIQASAKRGTIRAGQRGALRLELTAPGPAPYGRVEVRVRGGKVVARLDLTSTSARLRLSRLRPGKHVLRVVHAGTANLQGATTKVTLRVRR